MKEIALHLRRWQIVAAFMFLVASYVVGVVLLQEQIQGNHNTIHLVIRNKATITELETTNCKIKKFLLSSAALRHRLSERDLKPKQKAEDAEAAKVSLKLANSFRNDLCPKKEVFK